MSPIRRFPVSLMAMAAVAVFTTSAAAAVTTPGDIRTRDATSPSLSAAPAPVVSVAGDIACGTNLDAYNGGRGTATECRQRYTSDLILNSDAVWTLGDHVYPNATTKQLNAAYGPTWGRKKSVTYPSPGDHDYRADAGASYFTYFGKPAYYSFNIGDWHVVSLNSEIDHRENSPQLTWLRLDLSRTGARCVAAFWGESRWTSGEKGGNASFDPFWRALYAAHADLALTGDVHNYERFAKMSPAGSPDSNGIRAFVVGTGGRSLHGFGVIQPNSQARQQVFGVLKLTLRPGSYDWRFIDESRNVRDSGSTACNN